MRTRMVAHLDRIVETGLVVGYGRKVKISSS